MEKETILQISATIEGIASRSDKTWKITIGTQELDENQAKAVIKLAHQQGYFFFKGSPIKPEDLLNVPEVTPEFVKEKSPSQRLKNVLYRWWEQNYKKKYPNFEDFYKRQMERLIEQVKEKLE